MFHINIFSKYTAFETFSASLSVSLVNGKF